MVEKSLKNEKQQIKQNKSQILSFVDAIVLWFVLEKEQ